MDASLVPNDGVVHRTLCVSDTKTRETPTIPSERNSMQAQTQLMLYHRLLSGLIQSPVDSELKAHSLDFDVFWLRVGADPYKAFSDGFCEQTGILAYGPVTSKLEQQQPSAERTGGNQNHLCLNTLVDAWKKYVHLLGIISVGPILTLNYRRRTTSGRKKRRCTKDTQGRAMGSLEQKELEQAIIASSAHAEGDDPALAYAIAESLRDAQAARDAFSEQASLRLSGSPPKGDTELGPEESDADSVHDPEEVKGQEPDIIGSTQFVMDDATLDARLGKVLDWWHGIRRPEGVELEDSGRCQCVLPPYSATSF